MSEEVLGGGLIHPGHVVRVGDTVHRRDVFTFIEGDVPIPPYPEWAVTDEALRSVARLLRRYHEAASSFEGGRGEWADDLVRAT